MAMKPEILKIKENSEKLTPRQEKWAKLLDKDSVHPRLEIIQRMITSPESFDEEVAEDFSTHIRICRNCSDELAKASFEELEKAS